MKRKVRNTQLAFIDADESQVGDIITYHDSESLVSKIISWGSAKAGQWDFDIPAPSHVLIKTGEDEYTEADWGDSIFPFFPLIRKNSGVRQVSARDLYKRSGYHMAWRFSRGLSPSEKARIKRNAMQKKAARIQYDFVGLLSIAFSTIRNIRGKKEDRARIQDESKYFCAELVSELIHDVAEVPNHEGLENHHTSPALMVMKDNISFIGILPF